MGPFRPGRRNLAGASGSLRLLLGKAGERAEQGCPQHTGHSLQFLDRFCPLQLHKFVAVSGFQPVHTAIGDPEPHQMALAEFGNEGGALAITRITAGVATRHLSLLLQAAGKGLEAQHKIVDDGAILLSKPGKHDQPGGTIDKP